ncbi:MAG: hypothetical protein K2J78_08345, partial [Muribaculaceae bacterium]|nr:hypothetical protein [Muribaculaceae bacterium]
FYPYPDEKAPIDETRTKIYLSVEKTTESIEKTTGKVKTRLYRNTNNEYFTTPDFADSSKYTISSSEEVREYGWSAVPIEVDWKAGYEYNYYLDFSKGIGLHNSEDPTPGKPIKGRLSVTSPTTPDKWVDKDISKEFIIE